MKIVYRYGWRGLTLETSAVPLARPLSDQVCGTRAWIWALAPASCSEAIPSEYVVPPTLCPANSPDPMATPCCPSDSASADDYGIVQLDILSDGMKTRHRRIRWKTWGM